MEDMLPKGWEMIDVIMAMAAIAAFLVVLAVWNAALSRDPMQGRIKALQERREALRAGFIAPQKRRSTIKKMKGVGTMRQVVDKLKLMQGQQTKKAQTKLMNAGWRNKDAIIIYLFFKLVMPFLMVLMVVIFVFGFKMFADKPMMEILVSLGAVLVGFMGPDLFIKNAISKRQLAMRKALPDALDLMVICAEAGLTLDSALARVAKELGKTFPELADEFSLASIELGFLTDRRLALINLAERTGMQDIKAVVTTLIQTEKYGTPLANSLRVLSAEFRNERLMKAEEKAARLPAVMTIPLILFILPVLFVVLLGPATCQISDNFINR